MIYIMGTCILSHKDRESPQQGCEHIYVPITKVIPAHVLLHDNLSFSFSLHPPFLTLVVWWLFNRKQRQQPPGRQSEITTPPCTHLSTNVYFIKKKKDTTCFVVVLLVSSSYSTPFWLWANANPDPPLFYLLCSAVAKSDLCSPSSAAGPQPNSSTVGFQDRATSQRLGGNLTTGTSVTADDWIVLGFQGKCHFG